MMLNFFIEGGAMMWPLLILAFVIIVLSAKKAIELFGKKDLEKSRFENGIHAILFWGGISAVLGLFAHFSGVYFALEAIKKANDLSPAIVAGGYAVSLHALLFGLIIFLLAAILWFMLRSRYQKLFD